MGNYYCLMTGLPVLSLSNAEQVVPVASIKELIEEEQGVSKSDQKLFEQFFLGGDCKNILALLKDENSQTLYIGNYTREELLEMIADALEDVFEDDPRFPSFMAQFVREYYQHKDEEGYYAEDSLMLRYYQYLLQSKSEMVRQWAELNLNIANILTALIARQHGWKAEDFICGENDVTYMIRTNHSSDFGLGREIDYVPQLLQIVQCEDPVDKERRIDALKWIWLDDQTFMDEFSADAVFAYLCKAEMIERWNLLDPEKGQAIFREIIENLRGEAKVPEEFTTYM